MKSDSFTKEQLTCVVAEDVFTRYDYLLFMLLTGMSFSSIAYFMWYWFSYKDWLYYPLTFVSVTLLVILILANSQLRWFLLPLMRKPKLMTPRGGWKVGIATTFVPGSESLEMLEETLKALSALDYPHDTWVLDEGDDDQVKAMCRRLGAYHFSRKNLSQYQAESGTFQSRSRHGNYNAWLYAVGFERYEIIAQFDTDHVPEPAFLTNVLGYFEDPKIGYVQAAQAYYNQKASFIARGAAEETYAYYTCTQMAAYAMGYPTIVGGHSSHRVSALKAVGGFAPHDADDLLITLLYRSRGWQGVYVPKVLAKGLTPVDWCGYLTQQLKWARSVLDIKFRIYPHLAKNLPLKTRVMSFLHGLNYIANCLMPFTALMLIAVMLATGVTPRAVSNPSLPAFALLYASLQLCDFYRQRFYLDWRNEWGVHWRALVLHYAKWPYLLLALYQVVLGRRVPFPINPKIKVNSQHHLMLWPHLLAVVLLGTAWSIARVSGHTVPPLLGIGAAIIGGGSLALVLTEHLPFPDPYDSRLKAWPVVPFGTSSEGVSRTSGELRPQ